MGSTGIVRHCQVGGLEEEVDEHIPAGSWAGGVDIGSGSHCWSMKTLIVVSEVLVAGHAATG